MEKKKPKGSGRKPTAKQVRFSNLVASGVRQVDAYREAYDSTGNGNTARQAAHKVANNPNVSPLIEARTAQIERVAARSARSRSAWIIERLVGEAEDLENTGAIRVKALEVLGKASGLFAGESERADKRKASTEGELVAELEARLAEILPGIGVLDAEAKVIGEGFSPAEKPGEVENEAEKEDTPTPPVRQA